MKRFVRLLFFVFPAATLGFSTLAFSGCSSGNAGTVPIASTEAVQVAAPQTAVADESTTAVATDPVVTADDIAAFSAARADADAKVPDVAGEYDGKLQDRLPSLAFVDRGTIRLIVHQSGSSIDGVMHLVNTNHDKVEYAYTGTTATTAKGAILNLTIQAAPGRVCGAWLKLIGTTLFGKGWADPDAAYFDDFEQLIFAMHKK